MASVQDFLSGLNEGGMMDQNIVDYANQYDVNVNYNPENNRLLINGIPVDIGNSGLVNQNGQLFGTQEQYLNLLNPAYQNKYAPQQQQVTDQMMGAQAYQTPEFMKQFIQQMTERQQQPFEFDSATDPGVQAAKAQLQQSIAEMAGKRGFTYGGREQDIVSQEFQKVTPQFEELAYKKEQDFLNRQLRLADVIMQWDTMQANRQVDAIELIKMKADFMMKMEQRDFEHFVVQLNQRRKQMELALEKERADLEKRRVQIELAYKKIDYLGYADNSSASILGIEPGTEARWVKESEMKHKFQLQQMDKKLSYDLKMMQINKKAEMEIEKLKSKLDLDSSLYLMKKQYFYDARLQEQKSLAEREIYKIKKAQEEARIRAAEARAAARAEAAAKKAAAAAAARDQANAEYKYVHNQFKSRYTKNGVLFSDLGTSNSAYQEDTELWAAQFLVDMKKQGISNSVINRIQTEYGIDSSYFDYDPTATHMYQVPDFQGGQNSLYNLWAYANG